MKHLLNLSTPLPLLLLANIACASVADVALETLMESYWEDTLKASPLTATYLGHSDYNDLIDDLSPEAFAARTQTMDAALAELASIEIQQLSDDNRVNFEVFEWMLRNERRTRDFDAHLFTFTTLGGWHTQFASMVAMTPFFSADHYRAYVQRLSSFGTYTDQNISLMREGIEKGYTHPCAVLEGYAGTISGYLPDGIENSVFHGPLDRMPDTIPANIQARLRHQGRAAIAEVVLPAYQRFLDFYNDEYEPACRQNVGLSSVPNGEALYRHWVTFYTSLPTNPAAVHELGLSEVKRIKVQMLAIIEEVGFDGGFEAFLEMLRTDPQFYETDPEKYMAVAALIAKRADGKLPLFFSYLPKLPYGITPIPDAIAPKTTTAYYQPGSSDGSRAGQYFINLYDLASRPLYELPALTVHEAVPGHHLQFAIQGEMEGLPTFRRQYYFHAYGEGWGLYTELLGIEMGIYRTPYEHFGRLTYEMWRACRLVVDTGMHMQGWTRQQAIDFMAGNTALSLHNVVSEIDRYITYPGQALAYKHGELKIRELRARAETALGADFSLRDFHSEILTSGAVPLSVLENIIDRWIAAQKSG